MARFKDTSYSQGMLIEVKLWEQLLLLFRGDTVLATHGKRLLNRFFI
jgi:hypothetical protein